MINVAGGAIDRMDKFSSLNYLAERPFVTSDLLQLLCGDVLGAGSSRAVYECDLIRNSVLKVCVSSNANIVEYETWCNAKDTHYAKWFAPCLFISPCGYFLIQRKVRPAKLTDKLPKRLPQFFTDIKPENFGWIGKRFVCMDYQFIGRALDVAFNANLREVDWNPAAKTRANCK